MHGASVQCNIVPVARQTATANRAPATLRAEARAAREKQPKARRNSRATRGMSRARRSESSVAIAHCDRWRQVRGLHGVLQRCRAWADSKARPRRGERIVAEHSVGDVRLLETPSFWAHVHVCSADTAATDQAGTKRGSSRALLISSTYHVLTVSVVCSTD